MTRALSRRLALAAAGALLLAAPPCRAQHDEAIWYLRGEESTLDFIAHAAQITVVAPQVFDLDAGGRIAGHVDPRVVSAARAHHVKLMPLVMNPGFSQPAVHHVLTNAGARARAFRSLAALCREHHFDGIQFDLENINVRDRNAFTAFARVAADSVHRAGCTLSAAVVPRMSDDPGTTPFDRWMYDNWRGVYDYKALAESLDFLSYMTYAQHTGGTTPGPVQGYPWTLECLRYVLSLGVPREKISLGVAAYSDWWFPAYSDSLEHASGHDVSWAHATSLVAAAHALLQWDDTQKAAHAYWEERGVFQHAWIEDARAFRAKRALAGEYGLRGYSVWVLGTEDPAVWSGQVESGVDRRSP